MAPENRTTKLTPGAENDPCLRRRTMSVNVQDETFKDVNNLSLVLNTGLEDNSSSGSDSRTFALMVEPDDTIAAVKAYIQEEKGIPFKKQKLLNEAGRTLRDAQALPSLGIIKDSTLILRYAPATQIVVRNIDSGRALELIVGPDDTIGDVKAVIQKYEGIRFHKQKLTFCGAEPDDSEYLDDLGIQNESVLLLQYKSVTQVFVINDFSGRVLKVAVDPDDTIGDVKAAIYEKEGIRFHKQRLIFRGNECGDSELLADLGIQLNSELILRLI